MIDTLTPLLEILERHVSCRLPTFWARVSPCWLRSTAQCRATKSVVIRMRLCTALIAGSVLTGTLFVLRAARAGTYVCKSS